MERKTHRTDTRDEEEHRAIAEILSVLPDDHAARLAYAAGADTIRLSHLVGDPELARRLIDAFLAGRGRVMDRTRHFKP